MTMEKKKRPATALIVLAVILLIAGTGFGVLQIVNGIRSHSNLPSEELIHSMEEYLKLMEELEVLLGDPEKLKSMDADSYLDSKLQNCDLTGYQEQEIRELYRDSFEKAEGSYLDRELAMNALTREIIYYRQSIPNPGQAQQYMRNMLLIGIGAILLPLVLFVIVIRREIWH